MLLTEHEHMVEAIKAAGQELIDKAEEIASDPGGLVGYKIIIDIKTDTDKFEVPTIEATTMFVSEYATKSKIKSYTKGL